MSLGSFYLVLAAMAVCTSSAFQLAPLSPMKAVFQPVTSPTQAQRGRIILHSSKKGKKSSAPFDENLRTKLVSESIAPWRSLRLFLYAAAASGAALGGFITLTGTLAAISGARTDVDLNTEVN